MKIKEKCEKLGAFIREFKDKIGNGEQPKMCRKFEAMLVEKLKPDMDYSVFVRDAEREYTKFLVELGYDKALGYFWEESAVLLDYYSTWFDEVWNCYEGDTYDVGYSPWANIKRRICLNLGL